LVKNVQLLVDTSANNYLCTVHIIPSRLNDINIGRPFRQRIDLDDGGAFGRETGVVAKDRIIRPDAMIIWKTREN
jgi:hypothetical protein